METAKTILAVIGGYTVSGLLWTVWIYFRGDRTGNSGRFRHWSDGD